MSDLLAARAQMGTSLAFHIVFAVLGMGLPVLLIISEGLWLKTGNPVYLSLTRRWAKSLAVLFAVGAVSGTILSFELGLLWPRFMEYAGGIIGMPFSLEGFAFFTEAIFLGIYLYGWDRLTPRQHWLSAFPIAISGVFSAIFVVSANAWMNSPTGFRIENGDVVDVDPVAAMFNSAWFQQALHMTLAAFVATGFGVAGLYAIGLLRGKNDDYHRAGLLIAVAVASAAIPLQILSGDISARWVADNQPIKLAALEGQFETETGAPLRIGGWPNPDTGETHYAIDIPYGLSLIAYHDPHAEVLGLNAFPPDEIPDPRPVHLAFQTMVGIGFSLLFLAVWFWISYWRSTSFPGNKWLIRALAVATPLGFLAIEAGWTVTEVGRQPWTVYGYLRTEDAVTEVPGQFAAFGGFTIIYTVLAIATATLLFMLSRRPIDIEATTTDSTSDDPEERSSSHA